MTNRRLEDLPLVQGAGTYVSDMYPDRMLHVAFVRSTTAHGTITDIDVDMAADAPGIIGVFTGHDLAVKPIPGSTRPDGPKAEHMVRPVLATERVRFAGEPIVAVVAETAAEAADAASLVWVDVDDLPTSLDGGDDPVLFEPMVDNVVDRKRLTDGDDAGGFDLSVTVDVASQRLTPLSLEPLGCLASYEDDHLTVWCGHQAVHRLVKQLSTLLEIPVEHVRVVAPDVGGAFGMKGMLFPEYVVVADLARRLGRPVRWIQTRREQMVGGTHGRAQHHRVTLRGDSEGRAHRLEIVQEADTGAYPHNGSMVPMFSRLVACGLYDFDSVDIQTTTRVSNRAPTGSYRGAGRPEAALAIERAMDAFGRAAGLDPFEVRLRNMIGELPAQMATGALYDSGDYRAALEIARDMLDVPSIRARQAAQLGSRRLVGLGVGAFVERAGGAADSWEFGGVEIADGTVVVRTGSTDQGQGHTTTWTQIARRVFGDVDVDVVAGDTDEVSSSIGTYGSRSVQIGGSAVLRRAEAVLAEAKDRAADHLEAAVEDIIYADGRFSVAGVPDVEVSLFDLANGDLGSDEQYSPMAQTFPYGVHAAVVEVDIETGEVEIERIVAVDDCGNVLNPMIVEGQLVGSMAQGIGQALYEEIVYDDYGGVVTATLVDYPAPRAIDMPPIDSGRIVHPAPSNPLGAKGAGEAGCIGGPPAILNAALDALAPLGVTDLQLPLRPQTVWAAIQQARHG